MRRVPIGWIFRNVLLPLVLGALLTFVTAWACIGWAPEMWQDYPPRGRPLFEWREARDPDGELAVLDRKGGLGWVAITPVGTVVTDARFGDFIYRPAYGSTYFRLAGWPMYAVRSRVRDLDSGANSRMYDPDLPEPPYTAPRTRWDLPRDEIVHRGLQTNDLPAWMHAQPGRRLPIVPLVPGFLVNTAIYGLLAWIVLRMVRWMIPKRKQKGFDIVAPCAPPDGKHDGVACGPNS